MAIGVKANQGWGPVRESFTHEVRQRMREIGWIWRTEWVDEVDGQSWRAKLAGLAAEFSDGTEGKQGWTKQGQRRRRGLSFLA